MSKHDDFAKSIGATPADSHEDFAASIGATPVADDGPADEVDPSQTDMSLTEQVLRKVGIPTSLDEAADDVGAAAGQIGRGVPVLGPAAAKAGSGFAAFLTKITPDGVLPENLRGKSLGELYDFYQAQDAAEQKQLHEDHPVASTVGEMAGTLMTPLKTGGMWSPLAKTAGVAGSVGRVAANTGIAAADAAMRDQDPLKAAEAGGAVTAALEAVPYAGKVLGWAGKKAARVGADVSEKAIENYLERPDAVNAAKELPEKTREFLDHVKSVGQDLSGDSGKSFEMLKNAGGAAPDVFVQPLQEAADHLVSLGKFGAERKSAINYLSTLAEDISADAAANGGQLSLDKGKSLLQVLDAKIEQVLDSGADTQILKSLKNARRTIDTYLKQTVPDYGAHMAQLADETKALTGLTDRFSSDQGAMNTLKRIQQGRDPFGQQALANFDEKFSSTHAQDLKDAWTKSQFAKDTTNGSRKTVLGGFLGGWKGALAGAITDKSGGEVVKTLLDAGINVSKLEGTKYLKVLLDAANRGPEALAATHLIMMQNYPDYAETQK